MSKGLPYSHPYNLARLGTAGDRVHFTADAEQRAAIAKWAGILSLEKFETDVDIAKLAPDRFGLSFRVRAEVTQACVISLEPVRSTLERAFNRELIFSGPGRHRPGSDTAPAPEVVLDGDLEEGAEEIDSLHIDLAAPVLEEFALSLDPYPRSPGVEFAPKSRDSDPRESPFAVLKDLKQGS